MSSWRLLESVVELRRVAADVIVLTDRIVFGSPTEGEIARRLLPVRLHVLASRAARVQTVLRGEGAS